MTHFRNGPAAGQTMFLKRAPIFLRVVQSERGWDALDQLTDTPRQDETITVYRRIGGPGFMHIRARKGGGCFTNATYELIVPQPPDEVVRSTEQFRAWALEARERRRVKA